eukprot:TRINITY_DN18506_c0_g1_i1.p1 TRINITY_DN18506_c0_g1~~TRINITY_DN18506_c0_g1_i1.p1  ORF type:complete len:396 (+),score=92.38 TRINITY_DN18506_c0_g1_i1:69-1256(+)
MPIDDECEEPPPFEVPKTGGQTSASSFSDVELTNPPTTAQADNETATATESRRSVSPPPVQAQFASAGIAGVARGASAIGAKVQAEEAKLQSQAATTASQLQQQGNTLANQAQQQAAVAQQRVTDTANAADATLQREWDRLRTKEQELEKHAKELRQRELELDKLVTHTPNFPKHCYCIKPQVYHDIEGDIIPVRVRFIKVLYASYYLTIFLLIFQSICCFTALLSTTKEKKEDDDDIPWVEHFVVSLLNLVGICFAFMLWYWPTYQAVSTRVPGKYRMAYFGLAIAVLYDFLMAFGYPGHGGAGIYFAVKVFDFKESGTGGYMCLICAAFWIIQGIYFIRVLMRLQVWRNEDVLRTSYPARLAQEAMTTATTIAIGAQVAGGGGGGGGGSKRAA